MVTGLLPGVMKNVLCRSICRVRRRAALWAPACSPSLGRPLSARMLGSDMEPRLPLPTPSSSAAHSPVPMRSGYQPTMPFAASPALQV